MTASMVEKTRGHCSGLVQGALVALAFGLVSAAPASGRPPASQAHLSGVFDYYVLSLSWSPEYCAGNGTRRDEPQCDGHRRYSFVAHGLWPQNEKGFPQSCARGAHLDGDLVHDMLDIMPSPDLVRHEWATHGTCSGLDPQAYFAKLRSAFSAVIIPKRYHDSTRAFHADVDNLRRDFIVANPHLDGNDFAVLCHGHFLQEVRVCLDKHLRPRKCGTDLRDHCRGQFTVRSSR